jgi:hypothetical protein
MKNIIIVVLCLAGLALMGYVYVSRESARKAERTATMDSVPATKMEEKSTWKDIQLGVINKFFDDHAKGRETENYYCDSRNAALLYNVKEYKIVDDSGAKDGYSYYTVRIASSKKDGSPIEQLYILQMKTIDGRLCIMDVSPK